MLYSEGIHSLCSASKLSTLFLSCLSVARLIFEKSSKGAGATLHVSQQIYLAHVRQSSTKSRVPSPPLSPASAPSAQVVPCLGAIAAIPVHTNSSTAVPHHISPPRDASKSVAGHTADTLPCVGRASSAVINRLSEACERGGCLVVSACMAEANCTFSLLLRSWVLLGGPGSGVRRYVARCQQDNGLYLFLGERNARQERRWLQLTEHADTVYSSRG